MDQRCLRDGDHIPVAPAIPLPRRAAAQKPYGAGHRRNRVMGAARIPALLGDAVATVAPRPSSTCMKETHGEETQSLLLHAKCSTIIR